MKRSIHIEAPVETVFDSFKDPARFWDLQPFGTKLDEVKVTEDGAGTYYSWHAKILGLPIRGFDVLTDVVPNKHMTDRCSNALVGTWDMDFEPEGSGTKVTMEHRSESFWRISPLRNMIDLATDRPTGSFMTRVKDAIETRAR